MHAATRRYRLTSEPDLAAGNVAPQDLVPALTDTVGLHAVAVTQKGINITTVTVYQDRASAEAFRLDPEEFVEVKRRRGRKYREDKPWPVDGGEVTVDKAQPAKPDKGRG